MCISPFPLSHPETNNAQHTSVCASLPLPLSLTLIQTNTGNAADAEAVVALAAQLNNEAGLLEAGEAWEKEGAGAFTVVCMCAFTCENHKERTRLSFLRVSMLVRPVCHLPLHQHAHTPFPSSFPISAILSTQIHFLIHTQTLSLHPPQAWCAGWPWGRAGCSTRCPPSLVE